MVSKHVFSRSFNVLKTCFKKNKFSDNYWYDWWRFLILTNYIIRGCFWKDTSSEKTSEMTLVRLDYAPFCVGETEYFWRRFVWSLDLFLQKIMLWGKHIQKKWKMKKKIRKFKKKNFFFHPVFLIKIKNLNFLNVSKFSKFLIFPTIFKVLIFAKLQYINYTPNMFFLLSP